MPAIARVVKAQHRFGIYYAQELVVTVTTVDGIDEALAATEDAGFDPRIYVPGLHVAGLATAAAARWFVAWREAREKRDLAIRDHAHMRSIRVMGAFIGACSDGAWYDLIIDTAMLDAKNPG